MCVFMEKLRFTVCEGVNFRGIIKRSPNFPNFLQKWVMRLFKLCASQIRCKDCCDEISRLQICKHLR
ncbi:unnamed protein product [Moneuplotes crassus]|uniref:Uncharacterized protein n=1 Tax=Euplotes crassus TaxID=5936 RepID=A0AAD1X8U6_EUPCR|nr:unnamed protein product [Moneuplotes crassus]